MCSWQKQKTNRYAKIITVSKGEACRAVQVCQNSTNGLQNNPGLLAACWVGGRMLHQADALNITS